MTEQFLLPELGENIHSCTIVEVLVSAGQLIAKDQPVMEIETDKAVAEVPSFVSGTITRVHIKAGDTMKVGDPIITVEADASAAKDKKRAKASAHAAPLAAPVPIAPPSTVIPPPSVPTDGRPAPAPVATSATSVPAPAAPSVRRFAREIGIDIGQVKGSGPNGRISLDDVKAHARALNQAMASAAAPAPTVPLPDFSRFGPITREAMNSIRRTTARRMSATWSSVPQVTNTDQADITELERSRQRHASRVEASGGKLTITALLLKLVAIALKDFPKINASLDMGNQEIVFKQYYHVGVAVDTERGLLVPVIRDVDRKSLGDLCVELNALAERARNRKITMEELQGGTFTITNLGGIGGGHFTPIVNAPEVAILGVARSRTEAVWRDGQFQPRLILPLSLSYDHRLIDGADAARFLKRLVELLEDPFELAL